MNLGSEVDLDTPLPELLAGLSWTTLDDAALYEPVEYVRCSKHLKVPEEFRSFVARFPPKPLVPKTQEPTD